MTKIVTRTPAGSVYSAEYSDKSLNIANAGEGSITISGVNQHGHETLKNIMSRNAAWALCLALQTLLGPNIGDAEIVKQED